MKSLKQQIITDKCFQEKYKIYCIHQFESFILGGFFITEKGDIHLYQFY